MAECINNIQRCLQWVIARLLKNGLFLQIIEGSAVELAINGTKVGCALEVSRFG
ncbi:hypothetical protein D3C81_1552680 [compost metagenome]